jgi:hypothetical protein
MRGDDEQEMKGDIFVFCQLRNGFQSGIAKIFNETMLEMANHEFEPGRCVKALVADLISFGFDVLIYDGLTPEQCATLICSVTNEWLRSNQ